MKDAVMLASIQFLSWSICTLSWRAVAQANVPVAILTDSTLGTLQFFVIRKIAKGEATTLLQWLGYTVGGVMGTVTGIYTSLWWFGK